MSSDSRSLSQERFGRFAKGYVTSQTHAKGFGLERMLAITQPESDWFVLDIATGGGHTALKFAPYVNRVVAADLTLTMLHAAREFIKGQGFSNVQYLAADAESLSLPKGFFDLVTCRIAPHHFLDCARFVEDASRTLKPGGLLIVQDQLMPEDESAARYVNDFERLRDPSHHWAYTQADWVKMFTNAGLDVEYSEKIIKQHQLIPWAERQGCTAEVIDELRRMLVGSPPIAAEWLQARDIDTSEATFINQHIIISGRKPEMNRD